MSCSLSRAAFQYGIKMSEGRKTRRFKETNDKAELDRQWKKISAVSARAGLSLELPAWPRTAPTHSCPCCPSHAQCVCEHQSWLCLLDLLLARASAKSLGHQYCRGV